MAATSTTTRAGKVQVAAAATVGFVVAIFVAIPLAHLTRSRLGLPEPTAAPLDAPVDRPIIATYWVPWLLAWAVLLVPGIAFMLPVRTRRAGWAYSLAVGATAGVIALFGAWIDWGLG
ncbi:hypothetical protein G3I13_17610 [Streptomyces sp. SID6673]|nr:hypothetical protein [Streptomyces sp. SID11726]NEB26154.1 hypothetical protein [Streptomyces sp. SID6673]